MCAGCEVFTLSGIFSIKHILHSPTSFPPRLSSFLSFYPRFSGKVTLINKINCLYLLRKDYTKKIVQGHFCVTARTQSETLLIITGALCCHLCNTVIFLSQGPSASASVKMYSACAAYKFWHSRSKGKQELIWMRLCRLKIKELVMKRVYCQSPAQMSPRNRVMYREGCLL